MTWKFFDNLAYKKSDCFHIVFEPGDKTRYKFIISEDVENKKDYIFITGGDNTVPFKGYTFKKQIISKLFSEYGDPPKAPTKYQKWVQETGIINDSYISYVRSHSGDCNQWTALAAVICCYYYLRGWLKI